VRIVFVGGGDDAEGLALAGVETHDGGAEALARAAEERDVGLLLVSAPLAREAARALAEIAARGSPLVLALPEGPQP
jgi:vacuolar-type H+-ATPase subunit F/Vma7